MPNMPRWRVAVSLVLVVTAVAALVGVQHVASADELPLGTTNLDPAFHRLGLDTVGKLPRSVQTCPCGNLTFLLADLDGDGRVTPGGKDGVGLDGLPFIVNLPAVLLMPDGQFEISISGNTLTRKPQTLPVAEAIIQKASLLTEIRIAGGLTPVMVDGKLSDDCVKHCRYLEQNSDAQGMDLHNEYKERPGYTEEGRAAGAGSDLFPGITDYRQAVDGWYRSVWHGAPMLRSGLRTVGVAHEGKMAMLYFGGGGSGRGPEMHPPDGAVSMPTAFGERGEVPNPVAGSRNGVGCGFPIMVHLPGNLRTKLLVSATLTDADGNEVKGTFSCPAKPANPEWPSNSGVAAFVPAAPLAKGTFRARFQMEGAEAWEWTFSTDSRVTASAGGSNTPERLESDTEVKRLLRERPERLDLQDASLADALAKLGAAHGVPVHLDESATARLAANGNVSANVRSSSVGDMIDELCKLKHLQAEVRDGAVWIRALPDVVEPPTPEYGSATPEFKTWMEVLADVVPRGHRALKADSVSESLSQLNEQYTDKLVRLLDYKVRAARGDERKRLKTLRELIAD